MIAATVLVVLAAADMAPVAVQGTSACPTPAEVAAVLPDLLPAGSASYPDIAWIETRDLALHIELRTPAGTTLFARQISSVGTCADFAVVAAVVIASWTAERNPGLSRLQPAVPADPESEHRATSPPQAASPVAALATQGRARAFDLSAALGSTVNDAGFVGLARVAIGMRGRRLGLRASVAAETQRSQAIGMGSVSWRRYDLSLGPTLVLVERGVMVEAAAELFAGLTTVAGRSFDIPRDTSAVAPGLALAMRLCSASGRVRPWVEVGGQRWLLDQTIAITREGQTSLVSPLPSWEARLLAGVSMVLAQ